MEEKNKGIKVIILENNIEVLVQENVKIIRIKSSNYNLLIMKDYLPIIGYLDGSISIEGEKTIAYDNIKAVYSNAKNVFYLIVKGKE